MSVAVVYFVLGWADSIVIARPQVRSIVSMPSILIEMKDAGKLNDFAEVLSGLEGLAKAQPFPGVESKATSVKYCGALLTPPIVAVKLFNGVVTLEIQRRQNSIKARALILQMADMMSALLVSRQYGYPVLPYC